MTDTILIQEIFLCGTNDGDLYRSQITPIIKNLRAKIAKGTYKPFLAAKLWQYAADEMVRRYSVEHLDHAKPTLRIVPKADRALLAADLMTYYAEELGA